jgi:hypothetical protein
MMTVYVMVVSSKSEQAEYVERRWEGCREWYVPTSSGRVRVCI